MNFLKIKKIKTGLRSKTFLVLYTKEGEEESEDIFVVKVVSNCEFTENENKESMLFERFKHHGLRLHYRVFT